MNKQKYIVPVWVVEIEKLIEEAKCPNCVSDSLSSA